MTTKEQERKALAQIRKIVDGLGADSYIAAAFEGCFEIAADNIENDFACSMKQHLDAEIEALRKSLFAAEEKALSKNLYRDLWLHFDEESESCAKRLAGLADTMAQLADHPQDIAFINAVQNYRKCKERKGKAESILARLELYDPEKK